jgi:hypothetical protein
VVTVSNRKKLILFFLLNSLIGASLIYLLVSTFILRIFYSLSFFLFSFFLQNYTFSDLTLRIRFNRNLAFFSSLKRILTSTYIWGIFASLIIILVPSYPFPIYPEGIYLSFLSLSPIQLLRIILGYYIVAFFPGKIIYDLFLKNCYNFDRFEEFGFNVAISWIFCTTLGLILLRISSVITPISMLASIWLSILPMIVYRFTKGGFMKREKVNNESYVNVDYDKLGVLLSLSVILLFSSYFIHMLSQPLAGIYSGDILLYIKVANEFVNFGSTFSPYLWFQVYMKITSSITGLPLLYSLAGLQFFVLLPPISFYMLMKTLFPKYRKTPTLTAAFIFLQGLSALPIAIVLLTTPALYTEYMSGNILGVLNPYLSGIGAGVSCWISAFVNLIEVAIGALAFSFAYRYFNEGRFVDMFLGSLFLTTTIFLHGIFFIPLFFLTLTLFLLLQDIQNESKKLLLFIGLGTILFFGFEFLNRFHFLLEGNMTSSYFLIHYWPILPLIVLIVHIKEKTKIKVDVKMSAQNVPKTLGRSLLWIFSFAILFISLGLGILTLGAPLYATRNPFFPWYVYILCYGLPFVIAIGSLPLIISITQKKPLAFISCWLLSLTLIGLSGPYLLTKVVSFLSQKDVTIFNRFIMQIVYLTSCLGAIVLGSFKFSKTSKTLSSNPAIRSKLYKRLRTSSRQILPLAFTFMVAMSFLYIPYGTESYWAEGNSSEYYTSPMEAKALTWTNLNIPDNSIILSLSDSSYLKLCAHTRLKVIPPEKMITINLSSFTHITDEKVIADDQQSEFWTIEHAGEGKYQVLIIDDTNTKISGADSLKINVTYGSYATWYIKHDFSPAVDWSDKDMVYLYFYGANSGNIFAFQIWTPDLYNRGYFLFTDDFGGWKKLAFPLKEFATIGTFNLTNVAVIKISPESVSDTVLGVWYLDRVVIARNFIDVASIQTFLYDYLESLRASYVYITSTDLSSLGMQKLEATLFLSVISTFPIAYKNDNVTIYEVPSQAI